MKMLCLTISLLACLMTSAQVSHDFTLYTEDGSKFVLYVNGEQMNEHSQSKVVIQNVNHDYFKDIRIVFDNSSIPEIRKDFLQIGNKTSPEDQIPVNCIYKIMLRKDKYKIKLEHKSNK